MFAVDALQRKGSYELIDCAPDADPFEVWSSVHISELTNSQHRHVTQILQFFARSRDNPCRIALVRWRGATDAHHEVCMTLLHSHLTRHRSPSRSMPGR